MGLSFGEYLCSQVRDLQGSVVNQVSGRSDMENRVPVAKSGWMLSSR